MNEAFLYQCYRNGTTYEPEQSADVTVFFHGIQSSPSELDGYIEYSLDANSGEIERYVHSLQSCIVHRETELP